jgi:hypothetical protein
MLLLLCAYLIPALLLACYIYKVTTSMVWQDFFLYYAPNNYKIKHLLVDVLLVMTPFLNILYLLGTIFVGILQFIQTSEFTNKTLYRR